MWACRRLQKRCERPEQGTNLPPSAFCWRDNLEVHWPPAVLSGCRKKLRSFTCNNRIRPSPMWCITGYKPMGRQYSCLTFPLSSALCRAQRVHSVLFSLHARERERGKGGMYIHIYLHTYKYVRTYTTYLHTVCQQGVVERVSTVPLQETKAGPASHTLRRERRPQKTWPGCCRSSSGFN